MKFQGDILVSAFSFWHESECSNGSQIWLRYNFSTIQFHFNSLHWSFFFIGRGLKLGKFCKVWISLTSLISVFSVCALFVGLSSALYSSSDDVIELTPGNFDSRVKGGDELWLVEFYAPW